MKTEVRSVTEETGAAESILQAGAILRSGGLVAFPTETVYGLGADARQAEAAQKIYQAKGRPSDNPLIVHIAKLESLEQIATYPRQLVALLAEAFWPGPLTLILEKKDSIPYETTGGLDTVAVRMPKHEIALALIACGGGFVAAPSANLSGRPSPTEAAHVLRDLDGKIDMILDGGATQVGVESTILDMTVSPPAILRPGAITKDMLEAKIGQVFAPVGQGEETRHAPKAPGMKYRHYAPKAKMLLVQGPVEEQGKAICRLAEAAEKQGKQVGILATEENRGQYAGKYVKVLGSRDEPETIAQNLYRALRAFDDTAVEEIYSESFPQEGIGCAIMNRLLKAAGQRSISTKTIFEKEEISCRKYT